MPIETLLDLLADIDEDGTEETTRNNVIVLTIILRETLLKVQALTQMVDPN